MGSRNVGLVALSLVLGLGAAWLANGWLNNRLQAAPDDKQRDVVVATMEIPFGQMIEARQLALVRMPRDTVPDDAFGAVEEVTGKIATFGLLRGDMLRQPRVAEHLGGSTLASLIDKNKRAVSVRVDDVVGVGGFLLPGNRVDVLATRRVGNGEESQAKTILEDLRVLAVDQTASTDKTQPVVVRAVTLEMDPAEAEKLVKAMSEGQLQLALRNPLDNSRKPAEAVPVAQPVATAPRPAPRRVPVEGAGVTVIRGTDVNRVKL
ncbi:Flp pilus assembly protein CpaB [Pseudomonas oligotrophica]|uniref:Flp pilus assembly protein CpaB n=1 Tax=Pseudomonas oligotrophica TaxID=2912055 RepID=UPI001F2DC39F|nr:Flp pilus assembly protein CpaB [Pseudomonas oligotrophica]MCF7202875.1 Flp pilus assembly protein CpaB [Pseudomonas oligotrophica]